MTIRRATMHDLKPLAVLFDKYRIFYAQTSNIISAEHYLSERLLKDECVIFLALTGSEYAGFTQLYPSFSSIGMKPVWILNDLYVDETHRKKGIATALINAVIRYSRETGRSKILLSTAHDNYTAQTLYERIGFIRENFYEYEYVVN